MIRYSTQQYILKETISMNIERNQLLTVLSEALDCIEKEVFGTTDHHAKRVAWLCIQMGKQANMTDDEISDLAIAALLHDNALNEYRNDYSYGKLKEGVSGRDHCKAGEHNLQLIPCCENLRGFILYHHETADGSGPFEKTFEETPLGAQLIHIADEVDLEFALGNCSDDSYEIIANYVTSHIDTLFSKNTAMLFLSCLTKETFAAIANEHIETLHLDIQPMTISADKGISELFAHIIDYKSPFTKDHSIGIAQKAEHMGNYYNFDKEKNEKIYMAGALHDIGKLFINIDILEKPGKLDQAEYCHIQSHAYETYRLLSKIEGLAEIRDWASYHHEKLNGKGYPFGLTAKNMTFEMRLLACLDIYQALTENRPYKAGMHHQKAISILSELAEKGELDATIVHDIDAVFFEESSSTDNIEKTALFQCPVCGHVYEGDVVPIGYQCPVCGQPDHKFYRIQ